VARKAQSDLEYIFDDITIACTNTNRVLFPDVGITKAEMIGYYHRVSDVMLPELRDRPISVERFTKGIDQGGFFQKHAQKHFPAWIERVLLGSKTRVEYPLVSSTAALVYMANQGSVVFHVWTSRKDTPDHPDLLVFDLDPAEGKFDIVRVTALRLRELFDEIGLVAFVKTTGGKGLHVVAPLDGRATFGEVMHLCNRIARLLVERHPDEVTLEFYKKDRKGRLYLDVMRNALGATIVAAYSLRGRPGAPVSVPIEWREVEDPKLRPDGFHLREIKQRLDTIGDPWADLRARPGSVDDADAALDRLEG
jgi:bifunctional non-homologous end joining protein LigD